MKGHLMGRKMKHGLCKHPLYQRWLGMRQRCTNKKDPAYKNYGGRGISMCKEWDDFSNFNSWCINNGYRKNLTIDRIDNEKGYCPDNCRFITYKENQNNKRTNHLLTAFGETKNIRQWAKDKRCTVHERTIHGRLKIGFSPEAAISQKPKFSGNTSKYRGVSWDKENKKWIVRIKINYKDKYLGEFSSERAAAERYNSYAYMCLGNKAKLNDLRI
jgi:hypothetical protein